MPDPYKDLHLTNDTYEPPMYAPIPSHFSESEPRFPLYRSAPPSHRRFFRLQGSLRQEFPEQPTGAQCEILYEAFPLQVRKAYSSDSLASVKGLSCLVFTLSGPVTRSKQDTIT